MEELAVEEKVRDISPLKSRFSDAPWFDMLKAKHILLIGAGGIGSWVAFCLSRIGCDLSIFDMDIVETHNLGGQLYNTNHIDMKKTEATKQIAEVFSGGENKIKVYEKYTEDSPSAPIVIAAFDNMAGRKLAFEKWCELLSEAPETEKCEFLFIDGRLIAEDYQVYAVTKNSIAQYKETLFDDAEVGEVMCTLKATTHCSMGIAHDITGVLTNFITNRALGADFREVPFSIVKSVPLFTYDIDFKDGSKEDSTSGKV